MRPSMSRMVMPPTDRSVTVMVLNLAGTAAADPPRVRERVADVYLLYDAGMDAISAHETVQRRWGVA